MTDATPAAPRTADSALPAPGTADSALPAPGTADFALPAPGATAGPPTIDSPAVDSPAFDVPAFDSLSVGDRIPDASYPLSRERLVRYAGASGDFNQIHWNQRVAQQVGLPDVIAHGMLTMATASRSVTDWIGDPVAVVEYSTRFTRTVAVPDDGVGATVEVTGVIGELDAAARTARIDLTVKAAGVTVLGKARAVVRLS